MQRTNGAGRLGRDDAADLELIRPVRLSEFTIACLLWHTVFDFDAG